MRNQLEAAIRIGITARTINTTNTDEWSQIQKELAADSVDVLLISPERLANDSFRQDVLSTIAGSRYFCESLFWASQPKQAAKT
jgi:ATP-dependent DNA helicase RecQ